MKIPKLKSHSPVTHDNTEKDLIIVPPSVLDNKLRDFEEHQKMRNKLLGDVALAVALIIPVLTATFSDYPYVAGATLRGVFLAGFIFVLVRIAYGGYKLYHADGHARVDLVESLQEDSREVKKKE